jgi:energy-coupling factor transporter ATP-binding protein EcfA2
MLTSLYLRNFVIVREAELGLHDGMTAITGETGAGKSILIDALNLVLGGRTSSDIIRHGEDQAEIIASFDITGRTVFYAEFYVAVDQAGALSMAARSPCSNSGSSATLWWTFMGSMSISHCYDSMINAICSIQLPGIKWTWTYWPVTTRVFSVVSSSSISYAIWMIKVKISWNYYAIS